MFRRNTYSIAAPLKSQTKIACHPRKQTITRFGETRGGMWCQNKMVTNDPIEHTNQKLQNKIK